MTFRLSFSSLFFYVYLVAASFYQDDDLLVDFLSSLSPIFLIASVALAAASALPDSHTKGTREKRISPVPFKLSDRY